MPGLLTLSLPATCWRSLSSAAALVLAGWALAAPAAAQPVRMGGTGAALGTMSQLAKAYQQKDTTFDYQIVPNLGSAGGVKALTAGAIHLAVIGRPLKPQEAAAALQVVPYGQTAFVLATTKPGVEGLSLGQVADFYSGTTTRWSDGQPVRLVLRPAADADTTLLRLFSPAVRAGLDAALARPGMVTAMTDQDSVDAIERLPGGLGTSSMSLLKSERRRARALAIDGVQPTLENLGSGRYPYVKTLFLATRPDAPPAVAKFVAFIRSDAGARLLTENGQIPVPPSGKLVTTASR